MKKSNEEECEQDDSNVYAFAIAPTVSFVEVAALEDAL